MRLCFLGTLSEITVLETLRCPGCSTRFVIGPARVRPGLRQARCFRCETLFDITEAVGRLLPAPAAEPAPPPAAEPAPAPAPAFAEDTVAGGTGFVSARDAIEKLLGQTPPAPPPAPVRMPSRNDMDVEATLKALDSTLGATPEWTAAPEAAAAPEPAPEPPPPPAPEPPPAPRLDTASTVKLTSEELREAMAAAAAALAAPAPAPELEPAAPVPPPPELLKVQVEQETTQNVTLDQMSAWIEQGRVQEYHMVARQHSDNWIEAGKVPALRPVFERVRKGRATQAEEPPKPAPEPPPVKRGLFSGLFGRN